MPLFKQSKRTSETSCFVIQASLLKSLTDPAAKEIGITFVTLDGINRPHTSFL